MNLSEAYDLDDEKPNTPNESTNKWDQPKNLGGLRVGYHPESGLKAVSSCFDHKKQHMKDDTYKEYGYGYKKGRKDHDT